MQLRQQVNLKLVGLSLAALVAIGAMLPADAPPRALFGTVLNSIGGVLNPKLQLGDWQAPLPNGMKANDITVDAAAELFASVALGTPNLRSTATESVASCKQITSDTAARVTTLICRSNGGVEAAAGGIEPAQLALIGRAEATQQSLVTRTGLNPFWLTGADATIEGLQTLAGPQRIVGEAVRPFELGPLTAYGFCFEAEGTAEWYGFGNTGTDLLFLWSSGPSCSAVWPAVTRFGVSPS